MKWIFIIMAFMTGEAMSDDEIQKKNKFIPDTIENRVCTPHLQSFAVTINQRRQLEIALKKSKGDSKENLMYKIELMNAISVMQDAEINVKRNIDACLKNLK